MCAQRSSRATSMLPASCTSQLRQGSQHSLAQEPIGGSAHGHWFGRCPTRVDPVFAELDVRARRWHALS
eukprot:1817958-Alexandrium_andersonii.AAC.1